MMRKAIGAAVAVGYGSRNYTIEVAANGEHFDIRVTDGKRDNQFSTDGSTFEYEGRQHLIAYHFTHCGSP